MCERQALSAGRPIYDDDDSTSAVRTGFAEDTASATQNRKKDKQKNKGMYCSKNIEKTEENIE